MIVRFNNNKNRFSN